MLALLSAVAALVARAILAHLPDPADTTRLNIVLAALPALTIATVLLERALSAAAVLRRSRGARAGTAVAIVLGVMPYVRLVGPVGALVHLALLAPPAFMLARYVRR